MLKPITVEQEFDATREQLWRAVTEKAQMVQWYFDQIENFEPQLGHKTEFTVNVEGRAFVHQWAVTEVRPERRIAYSWEYADIAGEGLVIWDISEQGTRSFLRLTCSGIDTFPQDDPMFSRDSCENGWRYFINDSLKSFLDG